MNLRKSREVKVENRWLEVDLGCPHSVLSWAIIGGGWNILDKIIWHQVDHDSLTQEIDEREYFKTRLRQAGKPLNSAGFLTSASLSNYCESRAEYGLFWARCVATVGLSNALRIGDPPTPSFSIGTINMLIQTSHPLNLLSSMEALSLASEARTLAVLENHIPSARSLLFATGTGTDCMAVASPASNPALIYAGKHTPIGHAIGRAAYEAVSNGVKKWKEKWLHEKALLHQAR